MRRPIGAMLALTIILLIGACNTGDQGPPPAEGPPPANLIDNGDGGSGY